jgi:hypothetical protein
MAKAGQPTKYDPKYCEDLLLHMKEGYSFESFAGTIGTCRRTLYNWADEHPEFLHAKNAGFEASLKWYETVAKGGMMGKIKNFNATTLIFMMKNRFKEYSERAEDKAQVEIKVELDAGPWQLKDPHKIED